MDNNILPSKLLSARYKDWSLVNFPMSDGIGPLSKLFLNSDNTSNSLQSRQTFGISPEKLLAWRRSDLRFGSLWQTFDGRTPIILLYSRCKYCNDGLLNINMLPLSRLEWRATTLSCVRLPIPFEISPLVQYIYIYIYIDR